MQDASSKIYANNATLESKISTLSTNVTNQIKKAVGIGQPIIRLSDELNSDEIRLEGAEVSRETYANLFAIYGTTYGAGDGVLTFNLPDFRNRAIWGAEDFGYIEAGLPNIDAEWSSVVGVNQGVVKGAITTAHIGSGAGNTGWTYSYKFNLNASLANKVYGNADTVRPPSVRVRVVTRYK